MGVAGTRKKIRHRFSRPWMTLIVLMILFSGTVTACGSATPAAIPSPIGPTPSVTVPVDLPATITLAGRVVEPALSVLDSQIAAFEAENPDLKVEIVEISGRADQRQEKVATLLNDGDRSIDLFLVDGVWLAEFAAKGWLIALNDYVRASSLEMDAFFPVTVEANAIDGELLALPWTTDAGLLYYRQDLLAKYGYEPPATWPDLQRIALAVRAKEDLPYGFVWQAAAYESLTCNTLEFVWAYGGDVFGEGGETAFDNPQTQAALQQMYDLVASGASPSTVSTYDEERALTAFRKGEAVFMRNWSYAWERLNDQDSAVRGKVAVVRLPTPCQIGQSLALSAHSLHPEQAFRLMAFLVDNEQQSQLAIGTGYPPVLEAAYQADALAEDAYWRTLQESLSAARSRPASERYTALSEAIYTEVNSMLAGEQDVETTASNVQRLIEAALQQP